jgi:hypothetical protein
VPTPPPRRPVQGRGRRQFRSIPPIARSESKNGLLLLLLLGPILGLVALDRALVLSRAHWEWAAREVPDGLLDPYRVEAVLRSTMPGPQNVFVLGDSVIDSALDVKALNDALKDTGRRYTVLRIGGMPTAGFGFLANDLVALDPSAIILAVSGYSLRAHDFVDRIYTYDARVVPDLFTWREVMASPGFHLAGLAGQANFLIRRRHALQRALAVRLGLSTWGLVRLEQSKVQLAAGMRENPLLRWIRQDEPDVYPNPNTRAVALLARKAREHGVKLVVLETPYHPHLVLLAGEGRIERIHDMLEGMAREDGFTYVRMSDEAVFGIDDFQDHTHLNESGRRVFTEAAIGLFPRIVQ